MNRLEVLDLDLVAPDPGVGVQAQRHVTDQILDELRVLVGALGHPLLVGALEQRPDLAAGGVLGEAHLGREGQRPLGQPLHADRHQRTLVVRAVVADLLRAGAQGLDRYGHLLPERGESVTRLDLPARLQVEPALDAADRCALALEQGEGHLGDAVDGVQAFEHLQMALAQGGGVERRLGALFQPGHEARHVRALLRLGQRDVERPFADAGLHAALGAHLQRKAHALDADALDGQMALVALALRVGDR